MTETTTRAPAAADKPAFTTVLLALVPFGLGYFFSYLYRAVNAVVAPDLVRDVGLDASQLGLLTSAYLFAFAAFQLPLGILLDRYGPRKVQAALVAIGAAGAALFAFGEDVVTLTIARAMIGLGFAGGLMAGFKAVVIWVSAPRRALANAFVMSAGAVGLLVATSPTEWAVAQFGWREVFYGLAAITALVAVIIYAVVPDRPGETRSADPLPQQIGQLGRIMSDRVFLAIAPLLALTAGTQIAIQTLWAGPWMRDVAGLDRGDAAAMLAWAAFAFLVGVLASGAVADALHRRGVSLLTTMLMFLAAFMVAQVAIIAGVTDYNMLVWFVFGMCGQVAVLAYPWLSQYFGAEYAGRSNAAVNLALFATAFAVQYAIGAIIDLYPKTAEGGYAPEAYQVGFGVFFALQVVSFLWYFANGQRIRDVERGFGEG